MIFATNKLQEIKHVYYQSLAAMYTRKEIDALLVVLCQHFIQVTKEKYYVNDEVFVNESDLLKFNFALKDLLKNKPIQYIVGSTFFYGTDFIVSEDVLIPRPETEELIDLIINENSTCSGSIIDIGTGSGCIAVSLKKKLHNARVKAMDISEAAIAIASKNALLNHVDIAFVHDDICNIKTVFSEKFSIIVSNPPYVLESEKVIMHKNVLDYEPHQALFVPDTDPLLFYKAIAQFAELNLIEGGKLYFEINESKGDELLVYLQQHHFANCEIIHDLFGKHRFVKCIHKQ